MHDIQVTDLLFFTATTFTMEEVSLHRDFIHDKLEGTSHSIRILRTCAGTLGYKLR